MYAKPEVVLSGSALAVIQGALTDKGEDILPDNNPGHAGEFNESVSAYESDE
jgi:hypothetical protein